MTDEKKKPRLPVLPPMQCDEGCDLCCAECVPCSESELVGVLLYANEHGIRPQVERPEMCPWYQGGRCAVWEARPLMCHLFGHLPDMQQCPKGYSGLITTREEALSVFEAFAESGPRVRYLHEVLDAALPDPTRSVWRSRVTEHVWEGINKTREQAGLPPLARAAP